MNRLRWIYVVCMVLAAFWNPSVAQAGGPCRDFSPESIINTIQLAPEIPRQPSKGADRVFYEERTLVVYKPGMGVLLAGSADGRAEIVIDDLLEIKGDLQDIGKNFREF